MHGNHNLRCDVPWPIGIGATHVETQACNWDLRNVDKLQLHVEVEMEVEQVLHDKMSLVARLPVVAALMAGASLVAFDFHASTGSLAEEVVGWTHNPDDCLELAVGVSLLLFLEVVELQGCCFAAAQGAQVVQVGSGQAVRM